MVKSRTTWLLAIFCFSIFLTLTGTTSISSQCESAKYKNKTRVFISTDIGDPAVEPDDQMSLVRLLTYSNELDIWGLAASTSFGRNRTNTTTILRVLDAYENVVANLNAHVPPDGKYPSAAFLRTLVTSSHDVYGLETLDLPLSTAAEALIKAVDSSGEPLWFLVWGGTLILAETLQYVRRTRYDADLDRFLNKLRVYAISDQDDTGTWIRGNFPSLFYIVSIHGFENFAASTWVGISGEVANYFDKGGPDTSLVTQDWLQENIRKGPLGKVYPNFTNIMEGDTPSFLYLIPNGLGTPEHPEWGSWGGRYSLADGSGRSYRLYSDAVDQVVGMNGDNFTSTRATVWRWRQAYQYDFAARMNWTVTLDKMKANHAPVVVVNNTCGPESLQYSLLAGKSIYLDASQSWDPDGDTLKYSWSVDEDASPNYRVAVRYFGFQLVDLATLNSEGSKIKITARFTTTFYIILTVSDNQEKELVTYRRIVLNP